MKNKNKYYYGFIKSDKTYEENIESLNNDSTNCLYAYKKNEKHLSPIQKDTINEFPNPVDFYEPVAINSQTFMVHKYPQNGGLGLFICEYEEQYTSVISALTLKIDSYYHWYKRKFINWFFWK